ncbi:MAG: mechanosensitive ion channel, partial [Flavobacteriales bacterium]|nr:mechanosensitive ion channel [Flavobacteriales bacterium]
LSDHPLLSRFLRLLVAVLLIVLLIALFKRSVLSRVRDNDARYHARKVSTFVSYVLIVLAAVFILSDQLKGLTVALGVAGAGIAFALQEVIASVAGWLAILFGGFYRTGDRVQLGGIKGDVIDIGVLRTTVMELGQWIDADQYNGRIVRIANSFVFKEPVFNYSADFPFLWDEIKVPVQYGADPEEVRGLLLKAADDLVGDYAKQAAETWKVLVHQYLIEDASTLPMVHLVATDNWLEFTLRFVVDHKQRRSTKTLLYERIMKDIAATNGRIKWASATFQLVEGSQLQVRMADAGQQQARS